MELEGARVAIVSTDQASPAGFGYQNCLDLPPALRDRIDPAALAAVIPTALEIPLGLSVLRAGHRDGELARGLRGTPENARSSASAVLRLQAVRPQPIPNRRLAEANGLGHLRDRHPGLDHRREPVLIDPALCSVLLAVDGLEPVLGHPVRDRRWVLA